MCTVTWIRVAGGYELFCNRDERLERGPELPPSVLERAGVHLVAPRDSDFGGTWIAVNEHGIALNEGEEFGPGGLGHVRLNVATYPDILDQIIDRLVAAGKAATS